MMATKAATIKCYESILSIISQPYESNSSPFLSAKFGRRQSAGGRGIAQSKVHLMMPTFCKSTNKSLARINIVRMSSRTQNEGRQRWGSNSAPFADKPRKTAKVM